MKRTEEEEEEEGTHTPLASWWQKALADKALLGSTEREGAPQR